MTLWEARRRRAAFLARSYPATSALLTFYAGVAEWQGQVAPRLTVFSNVESVMPSLLDLVRRTAPPPLAQAAADFDSSQTVALARQYWSSPDGAPPHAFLARTLLQPYAASLPEGLECPWCAGPPLAGLLKPQGDALALELVCPLCMRRRSFPRGRCAGCNAETEAGLASFSADAFPHLRLLACNDCKAYLTIADLSKDIAAIPEVDELAALPLDLWAVDHGYHKMHSNIFGV